MSVHTYALHTYIHIGGVTIPGALVEETATLVSKHVSSAPRRHPLLGAGATPSAGNPALPLQCWVRMPTGCAQPLSETAIPTVWFKDTSGQKDAAGCASRSAAYNDWCKRSDMQHQWTTAPSSGNSSGCVTCKANQCTIYIYIYVCIYVT
jgi:hypothetical protein